jgi:hypothetical protein
MHLMSVYKDMILILTRSFNFLSCIISSGAFLQSLISQKSLTLAHSFFKMFSLIPGFYSGLKVHLHEIFHFKLVWPKEPI